MDLGTQLGQYRIERGLLGDISPEVTRGRLLDGLYLARDTGRDLEVVLRILPRGFKDPARMQRIAQRTRAALALKHPNIARTYNIGAISGEWLVATEYVHGEPLYAKVRGYPLSAADVAGIAIQVADALIHAHARGIVHGNITPSKIMMTPDGQVKLLSFGLGRELTDEKMGWSTWSDAMLANFGRYMSPEQLMKRVMNREEDSRSDLFSLGIVLYEMTTGRHPFPGPNPAAEMMFRCEQPEPVTRLNARIPVELGQVIHRCLEKDLDRRYQSARDLAVDLKNVVSDLGRCSQPARSEQ